MGSTALQISLSVTETLTALNDRAAVPLPLQDPGDLAQSIVKQACSLQWAVHENSQQTDRRARELAAYLLGFLLARARAGELDFTAGDAA